MGGRKKGLWIFLAAVSLTLVGSLAALLSQGRALPLTQLVQEAARPLQRLSAAVEGELEGLYDRAFSYEALAAENAALQAQIAQLETAARAGRAVTAENARLRRLLTLPVRSESWTLAAARVLETSWDSWRAWIRLDKGAADGLSAGNCVMDETGALVGRVDQVGETWSQVLLITDPALELSVQRSDGAAVMVSGGDLALLPQGKLALRCLPEEVALMPGQEIVTFAAQGAYPSGLLVGRLEALEEDPSGLTRYGVVAPAADLTRLGQVFCITSFSQKE